jgi:hypothetical protein
MQDMAKYRKLFAAKLLETDDFQQAFTKAVWVAYTDGQEDRLKQPLWTDEDEKRLDVIGQNGPTGAHYDEI